MPDKFGERVSSGLCLACRPFLGEPGTLEKVIEYKVKMVCEVSLIAVVTGSFKATHPYEEPAYKIWLLEIHA